jgi:hypothetical protein
VEALITYDVQKVMDILLTDVLAEGDVESAKVLQKVFKRLTDTFSEPKDINSLMVFLTDPLIQNNLGALTETVSTIDPIYIEGAAQTFAKIDQKNMPEIDELLGKLEVTLATFIMNPAILFSFFGDPEKAQVMLKVQKLLPLFTAEDLESVLNVKMAFDDIPDADAIFGRILNLPGEVLQKIFKLNLSKEELDALKRAAKKFMDNEDTMTLIGIATNDLHLLSAEGRKAFVSECKHKTLQVQCIGMYK